MANIINFGTEKELNFGFTRVLFGSFYLIDTRNVNFETPFNETPYVFCYTFGESNYMRIINANTVNKNGFSVFGYSTNVSTREITPMTNGIVYWMAIGN